MTIAPTPEQEAIVAETSASHDSQMITAYAGCAKALRNDQIVWTPKGPKPIGNLLVGEHVIGRDGKPYPVIGVFPQGIKPCWELKFSDGSKVITTEDHLWLIQRTDERAKGLVGKIRSTAELARQPRMKSGPKADWGNGTRAYWFLPMCEPVAFDTPVRSAPIDPWLLGVLLGDGNLRAHGIVFSSKDQELIEDVKVICEVDYDLKVVKVSEDQCDWRISSKEGASGIPGKTGYFNKLLGALQSCGLAGVKSQYKSIPREYLFGTIETRLAVLQGLMDTDGYADKTRAVFTSSSVTLAKDVKFIVESLGGTATENEFETTGMLAFRVHIKLPPYMTPFRLARKVKNYFPGQRPPYRALESVTKVEDAEATCISVGSLDHLFLTENFIPTHNTTTLQLLGKKVREPAIALAFNKSIATELKTRFADNFEVKTMNGFGYGALMRGLPQVTRWDLQPKKIGKLITEIAKHRKTDLTSEDWDCIRRLVTGAQNVGLVPKGQGEGLVPDEPATWAEIAADLWIPEAELADLGDLAHEVLFESNVAVKKGVISFDDQIYYPTAFGLRFPQFPTMLVDEAQDLSPLQHKMIERATRADGRLVVCGDPKQAIYQFRGADSSSMSNMKWLRPSWKMFPLTLTFRCPKVVVARQQDHAPGFTAHFSNADGRFARWLLSKTNPMLEDGEVWDWAHVQRAKPADRASIAILCRNNAPLFALAFKLLSQNIGVVMLGRDIGKGLQVLIGKVAGAGGKAAQDDMAMGPFHVKLTDWESSELAIASANDDEAKADRIGDQADSIRAISEGCRTVADLKKKLAFLLDKETGQVTLSSIHKSKGLEFDMVIHLDPWRVPSKQAKKAAAKGDTRALEQEWNLKYVCETRSKHTLIEANLKDFNQ